MRVRAPELVTDGAWVGSPPLTMAGLRGGWVLLHFWTAGCINCQHVAAELRGRTDGVTVVGVHSPKFPYEQGLGSVRSAVTRLGITHPVVSDPTLRLWSAYAVKAWPTLVLVDPDGYVAAQLSGEGHVAALLALAGSRLRPTAGTAGLGGLAVGVDGALLVTRGDEVWQPSTGRVWAGFDRPQGLLADPGRADGRGVLGADTGRHRVATLDGETVAELRAPWALARWGGALVVASAGEHRLYVLGDDGPVLLAGNGREGLRDGPAEQACLAQPSALLAGPDRLWFLDAETSSLRWLADGEVGTAIAGGLFAAGFVDGDSGTAQLQHPQALAQSDEGVLVADTYNGAVRLWDGRLLRTVVSGLTEPTGLAVTGDTLWVATADGLVDVPLPTGGTCRVPGSPEARDGDRRTT